MNAKVVVLKDFGEVDNFTEESWDVPQPTGDEVRIRIEAATVNPVDYKTRKGLLGGEPPMVLGVDLSGVVESVGDEVKDLAPGDEVFGFADAEGPASNGAYAEYVTLPRTFVAAKPRSYSHSEAAALAMVGLTAYQCLIDKASVRPGEAIFIAGGAGAVGSVAIQLARYLEAGPILTSGGRQESRDYVHWLGVKEDNILDYRDRSVAEMKEELIGMNGGRPVDASFDFVGGAMKHLCCQALDFDGRATTIVEEEDDFKLQVVSASEESLFVRSASLHTQLLLARARFGGAGYWPIFQRHLTTLAQLADEGHIRPHRIIELDGFTAADIADAHRRLEGGGVDGKLVIPVSGG